MSEAKAARARLLSKIVPLWVNSYAVHQTGVQRMFLKVSWAELTGQPVFLNKRTPGSVRNLVSKKKVKNDNRR